MFSHLSSVRHKGVGNLVMKAVIGQAGFPKSDTLWMSGTATPIIPNQQTCWSTTDSEVAGELWPEVASERALDGWALFSSIDFFLMTLFMLSLVIILVSLMLLFMLLPLSVYFLNWSQPREEKKYSKWYKISALLFSPLSFSIPLFYFSVLGLQTLFINTNCMSFSPQCLGRKRKGVLVLSPVYFSSCFFMDVFILIFVSWLKILKETNRWFRFQGLDCQGVSKPRRSLVSPRSCTFSGSP